MDFIKEYGLMLPDDINEIIFDLTEEDWVKGPEEDRDGYPGYVYVFKSNILEDVITYIKIRYNPPDEVVCISFHEDE